MVRSSITVLLSHAILKAKVLSALCCRPWILGLWFYLKWFAKAGSWNSSISITWMFVRNANSPAPSQTYLIRNSRDGAQQSVLPSPSGDPDACSSLRLTGLRRILPQILILLCLWFLCSNYLNNALSWFSSPKWALPISYGTIYRNYVFSGQILTLVKKLTFQNLGIFCSPDLACTKCFL